MSIWPTQIKSGGVRISNLERMGWSEAGVWEQSGEEEIDCDQNTLHKSIFSKNKNNIIW